MHLKTRSTARDIEGHFILMNQFTGLYNNSKHVCKIYKTKIDITQKISGK